MSGHLSQFRSQYPDEHIQSSRPTFSFIVHENQLQEQQRQSSVHANSEERADIKTSIEENRQRKKRDCDIKLSHTPTCNNMYIMQGSI